MHPSIKPTFFKYFKKEFSNSEETFPPESVSLTILKVRGGSYLVITNGKAGGQKRQGRNFCFSRTT